MSLFYIPDKIYDKKEVSPLHLPKSLGDLSRSEVTKVRGKKNRRHPDCENNREWTKVYDK